MSWQKESTISNRIKTLCFFFIHMIKAETEENLKFTAFERTTKSHTQTKMEGLKLTEDTVRENEAHRQNKNEIVCLNYKMYIG